MTYDQRFDNLTPPRGVVDVVLDTDAYNEIDDQFAISYLIGHSEKIRLKGLTAAPFLNQRSKSPEDGMEKSYDEILKLLDLMKRDDLKKIVYKGSGSYLPDEKTPVESEAADFIASLAAEYSPEHPLYIVDIGAITNVASAILKNPNVKENCVVIWGCGHSMLLPRAASEFNMMQDIAGARILFTCGVPMIQLPAEGVVDVFATTGPELTYWLKGQNSICDYLVDSTLQEAESYAAGKPWSRTIWDVVAVAWLLNDGDRFMEGRILPAPVPEYDKYMVVDERRPFIRIVRQVFRDALMEDLFKVLREAYADL